MSHVASLTRRLRRLLLAAVAALAVVAAAPSAASAYEGEIAWDLANAFIAGVTRVGGSTQRVGTATYTAPTLYLQQPALGRGTVASFSGGFRSTKPGPAMDLLLQDFQLDWATGELFASGHFYVTGMRLIVPFTRWHVATLSGGELSASGSPKIWESAIPRLTDLGAYLFNGDAATPYSAGDGFGIFTAESNF